MQLTSRRKPTSLQYLSAWSNLFQPHQVSSEDALYLWSLLNYLPVAWVIVFEVICLLWCGVVWCDGHPGPGLSFLPLVSVVSFMLLISILQKGSIWTNKVENIDTLQDWRKLTFKHYQHLETNTLARLNVTVVCDSSELGAGHMVFKMHYGRKCKNKSIVF